MSVKNRIVIITVSYNDAANLLHTIQSVRQYKQDYHRYFVIDGGSKDNTRELVSKCSDVVDGFISEPDKGIYDAMNKVDRFDLHADDFVLWLNAGDLLNDWSQFNVSTYFGYDCVFCPVYTSLTKGESLTVVKPKLIEPYNERNFFPTSMFMHQGFMVKLKVFVKYRYDLSVGLQAENLLMSTCIIKESIYVSDDIISTFFLDGVSSKNFKKLLTSYLDVADRLGFSKLKVITYQFSFILKTCIKIIIPYSLFNKIRKIRR